MKQSQETWNNLFFSEEMKSYTYYIIEYATTLKFIKVRARAKTFKMAMVMLNNLLGDRSEQGKKFKILKEVTQ